jgi:prefoldin subunit 5
MIDITQLEIETNEALTNIRAERQRLRNERREINSSLADLVVEERRLRRIANAFKPRRKAADNGESE